MNKKTFLSSLTALVFLLSATIASATFTPPSAPPPGNNTPPPLNVGSDAQSKKGNLVIEGLDDEGFAKILGFGVRYGNVGIGTLSPAHKLTIREGDASFATDNKGIRWNGIAGWDWYIQAKDTGASNVPLHFKSNYSGSGLLSRMTISSNGNVGIGTETPENKLDINTGIGGAAGVRVSAPGMGSVMLASGTLGTGNNYPGYIQWLNGAGTRLSYLGYDSATNMNWTLENGANLQIKGGNVELGGQIKIAGGSPGAGKVLTSDANGLATWQVPAAGATPVSSGIPIIGPLTDPVGTATQHQVSFNLTASSEVIITAYAQLSSDSGGPGFVKMLVDDNLVRTNYYGEECGRYCGGGTASVVLSHRQTLPSGSHTISVATPGSRPAIFATPEGGGGVQFYIYLLTPGTSFTGGSSGSGVSKIVAGTGVTVSPVAGTGEVTVSAANATEPSGVWCGSYNYSRTGANPRIISSANIVCKGSALSCPGGYTEFPYVSQGSGVPANPETGRLACVKD